MRTVFTFALGAAAGAAAARFLTPSMGRKAASAASSAASTVSTTVSTQAHHSANAMKGVANAVTPSRTEPMDDMTLADRVRSEIFRPHDAPKGDVSVDVQDGVAYLRGTVPDEGWIERLGKDARKVTGISGVKNLLHTPGTPAPH